MKTYVSTWARVGRRNRRRFHFIESQISDRLITFCGRTLDSTRSDEYVGLDEMPHRGTRCLVCERRQVPTPQPIPEPTVT